MKLWELLRIIVHAITVNLTSIWTRVTSVYISLTYKSRTSHYPFYFFIFKKMYKFVEHQEFLKMEAWKKGVNHLTLYGEYHGWWIILGREVANITMRIMISTDDFLSFQFASKCSIWNKFTSGLWTRLA